MDEHYLKKIDRITSILTHLQSKPLVRAQDLANKFEVSLRTIYRDIKTLENAGIPVVGEAGSGYSLMEGYKLPPIMFTKDEVLSFITAEKLMQKFSHESLGLHYETAMEKVKSVLKYSDRNMIQTIENQINVYNFKPEIEDIVKNTIPLILESINEKKQLKLHYQNVTADFSERIIEAVGIFFEFNYWYVMAFCTMRKDFRQFRIDRIQKLEKTEFPFSQEYGNMNDYRQKQKGEKTLVKILVNKSVLPHIVNSKSYYGLIEEETTGNGILITFETEWIDEGFPRWILTFADEMKIVEPQILQDNLNEILENIRNNQKK